MDNRGSPFRAFDTFLVREPLGIGNDLPAASGQPGTSGSPGTRELPDPMTHAEVVEQAATDPAFVEAVMLASPSLATTLRHATAVGVDQLKPKKLRHAAMAVLRYRIRMRSRPTPFGIFAGVGQGTFNDEPPGTTASRRHRTHIDMAWLSRVVHRAQTDTDILATLSVQTHQAIIRRGDRIVLETPATIGARPGQKAPSEVSLKTNPLVDDVLAAASQPIPFSELLELIGTRYQAPAERVVPMLTRLVEQSVLLTDLMPCLNGDDPLQHVIGKLPDTTIRRRLQDLDRHREKYDAAPVGQGRSDLQDLLEVAREVEPYETPVHVDTRLGTAVNLPTVVRDEAERLIQLLWTMSPRRLGMRSLRSYHGAFLERFGVDRLVPISKLLNEGASLGPPSGYEWPPSEKVPDPYAEPDRPGRDHLLSSLVLRAARDGVHQVELSDDDVQRLSAEDSPLEEIQNSCELYLQVLDDPTADFLLALSPSPGSHQAGATAARFEDLLDHPVEFGDAVHVERAVRTSLAFMPRSGRAANLAHVRAPVGSRISCGLTGAPGREEFAPSDIAVGANLERMYAVHLPTGTEVVPISPNMVSPGVQAPEHHPAAVRDRTGGAASLGAVELGSDGRCPVPATGPIRPRDPGSRIVATRRPRTIGHDAG